MCLLGIEEKRAESPGPQKHQSQNKKPLSLRAENLLLLKGALSGGSS